jgi:hypothetical protein
MRRGGDEERRRAGEEEERRRTGGQEESKKRMNGGGEQRRRADKGGEGHRKRGGGRGGEMRGGEEGRRKDGSGAGEREAMAKSAGIEDKRRPEGPRRAGRQRRGREDVKVRGRARRGCSPHLIGSPPTPPARRFPQASPTPIDLPPAVTHLPPSPPTAVVAPRAAASCPPPLYCRPRSGPQDALPARTSATKPPVARPPLSPPTFDLRWPLALPLPAGPGGAEAGMLPVVAVPTASARTPAPAAAARRPGAPRPRWLAGRRTSRR